MSDPSLDVFMSRQELVELPTTLAQVISCSCCGFLRRWKHSEACINPYATYAFLLQFVEEPKPPSILKLVKGLVGVDINGPIPIPGDASFK